MTDEDTLSGEIATLRRQLRIDVSSLVYKYASRIDGIERARPWFVGGAVLGAALTGLGRLDAGTLGIVITAVGIVVATIFGALVGATRWESERSRLFGHVRLGIPLPS